MQQAQQAWHSLITQLHTHISQTEPELKKALMQMVVQICRGIFVKEMQLSPDHIQAIVHKALQAFPLETERVQLFLNADDHAELDALTNYQPQQTIDSVIDDTLTSGGCLLKSKYSYVDYTLERRFKKQLKALIETIPDLDWDTIQSINSDHDLDASEQADVSMTEDDSEKSDDSASNAQDVKIHEATTQDANSDNVTENHKDDLLQQSFNKKDIHIHYVNHAAQARQKAALLQPITKGEV